MSGIFWTLYYKMKNIGFVGLGKLGLPVAVCIDLKGFNILGYDINPKCNKDGKPIDLFYTSTINFNANMQCMYLQGCHTI